MNYQLTPDKYLTSSEVHDLRNRLTLVPEVQQLYFLVLLSTGARASEALNLRPSDLNHETKSVHIRGLKNSRDRSIALTPELFDRLSRLAIGGVEFIFPWKLRNADLWWRRVRPCAKKLHALRHTFAVNLYRKTRDIALVQFALGHKNIRNTMIYLEIDQTEELRRVMTAS